MAWIQSMLSSIGADDKKDWEIEEGDFTPASSGRPNTIPVSMSGYDILVAWAKSSGWSGYQIVGYVYIRAVGTAFDLSVYGYPGSSSATGTVTGVGVINSSWSAGPLNTVWHYMALKKAV